MDGLLFRAFLRLQQFSKAEDGQDLIEYALIVALVSLAAIAGLGLVGSSISAMFNNLAKSV